MTYGAFVILKHKLIFFKRNKQAKHRSVHCLKLLDDLITIVKVVFCFCLFVCCFFRFLSIILLRCLRESTSQSEALSFRKVRTRASNV